MSRHDSPEDGELRIPKVLQARARKTLEKEAHKIDDEAISEVVEKADTIEEEFASRTPLVRFLEDAKLMLAMLKDFTRRRYTRIPFWTIAAVAAAMLYVLNPFDLMPDFIPVLGQLDDAAVFLALLKIVEKDLIKYKSWLLNLDATVREE